jgi:hypothetical protein
MTDGQPIVRERIGRRSGGRGRGDECDADAPVQEMKNEIQAVPFEPADPVQRGDGAGHHHDVQIFGVHWGPSL